MRLLWCALAVAAGETQRDLAAKIADHYKAQAAASRSKLDIQAAPSRQDPFVFLEAAAPRSGNVISPQLFRRYGYFEGEFPLPVRSLE